MSRKDRISLLAIIGLAFFSVNICAQTPKADLLDVRFNVDGTATDVSGRERPIVSGLILPSVAFNDTYNLYAASFTGSGDDYYYFDYAEDQEFIDEVSGDFTMECLMRIDNLSKEQAPFCTTENSGFGFDISWFSDNDLSFLIHDGSHYVAVTDKSMEEGKYYHAVGVVRPNDAISFYVNGVLIGTTPFTTVRLPSGSCQRLYVGSDVGRSGSSQYAFKGEIVVARMYSRALTDEEVKAVYDELAPDVDAPKADLLDVRFHADGTATDVSGREHPIVSSPTLPSVAFNDTYNLYAATFTGSGDDYYYFDYAEDQEFMDEVSGDFTMECLMWIDNLSKAQAPFCSTESSGFGFDIGWFASNGLSFLMHDGSRYVAVYDKSLEAGNYYHAVGVVRPNDAISFYVNGVLIGSTPFSTLRLPGTSSRRLYVGCDVGRSGNAEFAFKGEVVVARMYSRALTDKEVKAVYDVLASGNTGIIAAGNNKAEADNDIYTLTGIKVSQPLARGIYIVNGRKVVKK